MKSLILSVLLTSILFVYFITVFEQKASFLNKISNTGAMILAVFIIGYLVSLYWGLFGIFKGQRIPSFIGLCFSLFGLGIFGFGFYMNMGPKEKPGQFDRDLAKVEITQQTALRELLQQTNTDTTELQFTNYWGMHKNPNTFVICIQKGNIIGLQIKNKPVTDIKVISKLKEIDWLVLENCGLKSIVGLDLNGLNRLEISNNQLTNLDGIGNEPRISYLDFRNNPITDSSALKNHPNKSLYIFN